jgi:hypothetical protein
MTLKWSTMQWRIHGTGAVDMETKGEKMKNRECVACGDKITHDRWMECDKCSAVFCDRCIDDNLSQVGDLEDPGVLCNECMGGGEENDN